MQGSPFPFPFPFPNHWLEALGADVVFLPYDNPASASRDDESITQAEKVHGIVFPGGRASIDRGTAFGDFSFRVFKMALDRRVPIWGTCLGIEQLISYSHEALGLVGTPAILSKFDAEDLVLGLDMTAEGRTHPWWTGLSKSSRGVLTQPITLHFHKKGFARDEFITSSAAQVWDLIATNVDRQNDW